MSEELLQQSIAALKAGRKTEARHLLERAVQADLRSERSWLWLSGEVDTDEERRYCLTQVLSINPRNTLAQWGLEALGPGPVQSPLAELEEPLERTAEEPPVTPATGNTCSHCNTLSPPTFRFCDRCGKPLPQSVSEPGSPPPQTHVTCPQCGTSDPVGFRHCDHCGALLGKPAPKRTSKWLVTATAMFVSLLGVALITFLVVAKGHPAWALLPPELQGLVESLDPDSDLCCYAILEDMPYSGLTDIRGAYYDDLTDQVVLVGSRNLSLPPVYPADLVVLHQALASNDEIGVSIEPYPIVLLSELASGDLSRLEEFDALDGEAFVDSLEDDWMVRYIGDVEGTHVGEVFYQADRYLKTLLMGRDNITGEKVDRRLPFHQDQFELVEAYQTIPPLLYRVWYVPETVAVNVSPDGRAIWFDDVRVRVQAEGYNDEILQLVEWASYYSGEELSPEERALLASIGGDGQVIIDAFTEQINDRYDSYAAERPELFQLVQLVRLMSILRWVEDYRIPADMWWMYDYPLEYVDTPATTPAVIVKADMPLPDGRSERAAFPGGVIFRVVNHYVHNPGTLSEIEGIRATCRGASPCESQWGLAMAMGPSPLPDPGAVAAARRGVEQERAYIKKLGRAGEMATLYALQGESPSDLNQVIHINTPLIDVSTNQRLVSVKASLARTLEGRLDYLEKSFDDLFGPNSQQKRLDAAKALSGAADRISLPTDFPIGTDEASLLKGAKYIRDRAQLWVPANLVEPLIKRLEARYDYDSQWLRRHVKGFGLQTGDLLNLMPAN